MRASDVWRPSPPYVYFLLELPNFCVFVFFLDMLAPLCVHVWYKLCLVIDFHTNKCCYVQWLHTNELCSVIWFHTNELCLAMGFHANISCSVIAYRTNKSYSVMQLRTQAFAAIPCKSGHNVQLFISIQIYSVRFLDCIQNAFVRFYVPYNFFYVAPYKFFLFSLSTSLQPQKSPSKLLPNIP